MLSFPLLLSSTFCYFWNSAHQTIYPADMQANFLSVLMSCLICFCLREKRSHSQCLKTNGSVQLITPLVFLNCFHNHQSNLCITVPLFPSILRSGSVSVNSLLFLTFWSFGIVVDLPITILIDNSSIHHIKTYPGTVPCNRLFFQILYINLHIYLITKIKQTSLKKCVECMFVETGIMETFPSAPSFIRKHFQNGSLPLFTLSWKGSI